MIEETLFLGIILIIGFLVLGYMEAKTRNQTIELEIKKEKLRLENIFLKREVYKREDIIHMIKDKTEFVQVDDILIFYKDPKKELDEIFERGD